MKEINILGSLSSRGGGEQSLCDITAAFRKRGWIVHLYPWDTVEEKHRGVEMHKEHSFVSGKMLDHMEPSLPLFFYGNDQIYKFIEEERCSSLVEKCSSLHIGINFSLGSLPRKTWLASKLRQVLVQNREKADIYEKKRCEEQSHVDVVVLSSPIDVDKYLDLPVVKRESTDAFVILKHCTADGRKFVLSKYLSGGDCPHVWQKHNTKEADISLYRWLLHRLPDNVRFEFMTAPPELKEAFKDELRMVFRRFDEMPVTSYLSRGHLYFYRTSNHWNDQGPRCVEEAMAAGLPVIGENRNGPADRIQHGNTGFYAFDRDDILSYIELCMNNEEYRQDMAEAARKYADLKFRAHRWPEAVERNLSSCRSV